MNDLTGYYRRIDGAIMLGNTRAACDRCGNKVFILIGIEKDYPSNPDKMICPDCTEEMFGVPLEEM